MRVINLTENSSTYTANVYFVRGSWNAIDDVNTLVDVGRDSKIIERIDAISGGVGKKKIDQVILTHSHYDHASLLPLIRKIYDPVVYAFSPYLEGVDYLLKGGEKIKIGDGMFEVIHTPIHSADSICLYCEEEGVLFAGDTPIAIRSADEIYDASFIEMLIKLYSENIQKIYPGHGDPVTEGSREIIYISLTNMRRAKAKKMSKRVCNGSGT